MSRINREAREEIKRRFQAGESKLALARAYKIDPKTVTRIVTDYQNSGKEELKTWFEAQWANIYPGDKERKERAREAVHQPDAV